MWSESPTGNYGIPKSCRGSVPPKFENNLQYISEAKFNSTDDNDEFKIGMPECIAKVMLQFIEHDLIFKSQKVIYNKCYLFDPQ